MMTILEGTVSLTQCLIAAFLQFWRKRYWDLLSEIEFLRLAKQLAGFETGTFWFCDALNH